MGIFPSFLTFPELAECVLVFEVYEPDSKKQLPFISLPLYFLTVLGTACHLSLTKNSATEVQLHDIIGDCYCVAFSIFFLFGRFE